MGDNRLGRRGIVVADVIDGSRLRLPDRGDQHTGQIIDMNAREHLTGFLNSLCGAGPQRVEGAAAWPVNPSEPKNVQRRARAAPEIEPSRFGGDPASASLAGGSKCRGLIDPAAVTIAVNSGRGEIADPG